MQKTGIFAGLLSKETLLAPLGKPVPVLERAFHSFKEVDMSTQKLLRVSYCAADAALALKTPVPAMDAGFNVNTCQGDFSVGGVEAQALARWLSDRLQRRLKTKSVKPMNKART